MRYTIILIVTVMAVALGAIQVHGDERPNILFYIADDMSARHCGAYGDTAVRTPGIDRLAREGVRFTHAFTAAPSCTPSRAAILTGQAIYRLEEGGILMGTLPVKFEVFPLMLEEAGYFVGYTGKGWGPGNLKAGGRTHNPIGKAYNTRRNTRDTKLGEKKLPVYFAHDYVANFEDFLKDRPEGKPFFFWYGSVEPHLPWPEGEGLKRGKKLEDASVPASLPDHEIVRSEVLDYYVEIEEADKHLNRMIEILEASGELDNTMIIATSDHGIPLPRAKCSLYDAGTHVPLVVRYPKLIQPGRVVDDFVSLTDIAPTILELVGIEQPKQMTSLSFMQQLTSDQSGYIDLARDYVVIAFERHTWCRPGGVGYPMRAIRTSDYLYIRNYEMLRWPAGDPDFKAAAQGPLGDADSCNTKWLIHENREDKELGKYWNLAYGKRNLDELYRIADDPDQINDLTSQKSFDLVRSRLNGRLHQRLIDDGDPRARGITPWDRYEYYADKGPDQPAKKQ